MNIIKGHSYNVRLKLTDTLLDIVGTALSVLNISLKNIVRFMIYFNLIMWMRLINKLVIHQLILDIIGPHVI